MSTKDYSTIGINKKYRIRGTTWLVSLFLLFSISASSQIMGANYNERLDLVEVDLIRQSKVKWIRAFIPIMDLLRIQNGRIVGVNDDAINRVQIGPFLDCHRILGTKLILSWKINYRDIGRVPAPNSAEANHIITACRRLLSKAAGPRGNVIQTGKSLAILTVGNEPMYETPRGAVNYKALTNRIINEMNTVKNNRGYSYDIYLGAVNDYSSNRNHPIAQQTIELTKEKGIVRGMDIHCHIDQWNEIRDDYRALRQDLGNGKDLISTEWSLHRLLRRRLSDRLGAWGANNGFGRNTRIYEFVNRLVEMRNNGNPISYAQFNSFWNSRGWYQRNWVDQFYQSFKDYKVSVAPYGMVRENIPGYRMNANSPAWIFNALYNDHLMGRRPGFQARTNPVSHPRWKFYVDNPGAPTGVKQQSDVVDNDLSNTTDPILVDQELKLLENPVIENLYVQFDSDIPGTLTILSLDGSTVLTRNGIINEQKIELGNIPQGMYILRINNGISDITRKIIIN